MSSASASVDYRSIARAVLATAPRKRAEPKRVPRQLDFGAQPSAGDDEYQVGHFPEGTFVSHLASTVEIERGEYNVLVPLPDDPPAPPPRFLLATNGWHPQSEALRPAFLIHGWRLLVAVEEELAAGSEPVGGPAARVVAAYDCGEDSGVTAGHKSIRFYLQRGAPTGQNDSPSSRARLPVVRSALPPMSLGTAADRLGAVFRDLLADHVPRSPPYNLVFTRDEAVVVRREAGSDGLLAQLGEGRWDGARLLGIDGGE